MRNEKEQWYCEWANSLGTLEDTAENVWGTLPYDENKHPDENVVFFGLYGFPSFFKLWKHKGRKVIFWAGSDIRHFLNGYWLDKKGEIRLDLKALALWINAECENWVENEVEQKALAHIGIVSKICPSFLGDTDKFEISYEASNAPKLYTSISGDDFELYQWQKTMDIASQYPHYEFHFYGNTIEYPHAKPPNAFIHGRVPKEQMNEEIKNMQGAVRLIPLEGFSEIIAKSLLMGQWPVSLIPYPHTLSIEDLPTLKYKKEPNTEGRQWVLSAINRFPWNLK